MEKNVGIWKSYFHWRVLLSWDVLGWIIGTLLAVAGILLIFDLFLGANICFGAVAVFILAKIVHVAAGASDPVWHRLLFTFVLFGIVGLGVTESIRGINRWANSHRRREAANEQQHVPQTSEKSDKPEGAGNTGVNSPPAPTLKEPRTAVEQQIETREAVKARDTAKNRLTDLSKQKSEAARVSASGVPGQVVGTGTITVRGPQLGLKEQALITSSGILDFLVGRERNAPPYPSPDLSPTDWSKEQGAIRAYNAETMREFIQAWSASVMELHDKLAAKGLQDPALDDLYNRPTSSLGIRVIGEKIGDLATKLPPDQPDPKQ